MELDGGTPRPALNDEGMKEDYFSAVDLQAVQPGTPAVNQTANMDQLNTPSRPFIPDDTDIDYTAGARATSPVRGESPYHAKSQDRPADVGETSMEGERELSTPDLTSDTCKFDDNSSQVDAKTESVNAPDSKRSNQVSSDPERSTTESESDLGSSLKGKDKQVNDDSSPPPDMAENQAESSMLEELVENYSSEDSGDTSMESDDESDLNDATFEERPSLPKEEQLTKSEKKQPMQRVKSPAVDTQEDSRETSEPREGEDGVKDGAGSDEEFLPTDEEDDEEEEVKESDHEAEVKKRIGLKMKIGMKSQESQSADSDKQGLDAVLRKICQEFTSLPNKYHKLALQVAASFLDEVFRSYTSNRYVTVGYLLHDNVAQTPLSPGNLLECLPQEIQELALPEALPETTLLGKAPVPPAVVNGRRRRGRPKGTTAAKMAQRKKSLPVQDNIVKRRPGRPRKESAVDGELIDDVMVKEEPVETFSLKKSKRKALKPMKSNPAIKYNDNSSGDEDNEEFVAVIENVDALKPPAKRRRCSRKSKVPQSMLANEDEDDGEDQGEIFFCFLCQKESDVQRCSKEAMLEHIRHMHMTLNKGKQCLSCLYCSQLFPIRNVQCRTLTREVLMIVNHMINKHEFRTPSYIKTLKCTFCTFTTIMPYVYNRHLAKHIGSDSVMCDGCGMTMRKQSLKRHMEHCGRPRQRGPKPFNEEGLKEIPRCDACGKQYCTKAAVKRHYERRHGGEAGFLCSICPARCYAKTDLERHMFCIHRINITKRVIDVCSTCGYQTLEGSLMRNHLRTHEVGEYPCGICNKVLRSMKRLKAHMEIHSEGTKKRQCPLCEYKARKKYDIDRHMARIHHGIRWNCDRCPYATFTKEHLVAHYQKAHKVPPPADINNCLNSSPAMRRIPTKKTPKKPSNSNQSAGNMQHPVPSVNMQEMPPAMPRQELNMGRPELNLPRTDIPRPELNLTRPELNLSRAQELNLSTRQELNLSTRQELNLSGRPENHHIPPHSHHQHYQQSVPVTENLQQAHQHMPASSSMARHDPAANYHHHPHHPHNSLIIAEPNALIHAAMSSMSHYMSYTPENHMQQ